MSVRPARSTRLRVAFSALFALAMVAATAAAEAQMLISPQRFENLVELCGSDDDAKGAACTSYIIGVLDGRALSDIETGQRTLCYPEGSTDIGAIVETIVTKLHDENLRADLDPDLRTAPASVPVSVIASENFRCPNAAARLELRGARYETGVGLTEMTVPRTNDKVYVAAEPLLTNQDVLSAQAKTAADGPFVEVTLSGVGARLMRAWTATNIGQPLSIIVDGKLVEAPIIRETFTEGTIRITGAFTPGEAEALARRLVPGSG
jgi:hypothetical protein